MLDLDRSPRILEWIGKFMSSPKGFHGQPLHVRAALIYLSSDAADTELAIKATDICAATGFCPVTFGRALEGAHQAHWLGAMVRDLDGTIRTRLTIPEGA